MIEIPGMTISALRSRRRELGMSFPALAKRSGVPVPTVKRVFAGRGGEASYSRVAAIAGALGVSLRFEESDGDAMRREQARKKAALAARLVQGTSALEGQAVDPLAYERLAERTYHELLSGPSRRLWDE